MLRVAVAEALELPGRGGAEECASDAINDEAQGHEVRSDPALSVLVGYRVASLAGVGEVRDQDPYALPGEIARRRLNRIIFMNSDSNTDILNYS